MLMLLSAIALLSRTGNAPEPPGRLAQFGQSVAVVGDMVYVGESRAGAKGGMVRMYRRATTGAWRMVDSLASPFGRPDDGFGFALGADARSLLVSSSDINGTGKGGAVVTYARTPAGNWKQTGILAAANGTAAEYFGVAIALHGDEAAVTAFGEGRGVVHFYKRAADGSWAANGSVSAPESMGAKLRFGRAITWQGDYLALGATHPDTTGTGAAYVFHRGADGRWDGGQALSPAGFRQAYLIGRAVLLSGNRLFVGAPSVNDNLGAVIVYQRDSANGRWMEETQLRPYESVTPQGGGTLFGISLATVAGETWIGAPGASVTGGIFRVQPQGEKWSMMQRLAIDSATPGSFAGVSIAGNGTVAATGMTNSPGGGAVALFSRSPTRGWAGSGALFVSVPEFMAVTGGEVDCSSGKARSFGCGNTSLLSFLPISKIGGKRGTNMNDNWGWTDSLTGKEYALLGRTDGTSFVDISDPTHPRYLGDLPLTKGANPAAWRDIKTYKGYAYIVSDGAGPHGMQVFDLKRLRTVKTPQLFEPDYTYRNINSAHNIVINENTGFAYAVGASSGGETCGGGLHMIDIRDMPHPVFAGCFADPKTGINKTGYSHDAQCVTYHGPDSKFAGREICIGSNETGISVADVTDKKNPVAISNAAYPDVAYAHQGWFTDDHRYFYLDDEGDETTAATDTTGNRAAGKGTRTLIWDLSKLDDPVMVGTYIGTTKSIDHNLYVKGNRLYEANYSSGLRIMDITDPRKPREVGYFDTYPADDAVQFTGAWSTYPYFKSGTIIITSIGEGVFFVKDKSASVVP